MKRSLKKRDNENIHEWIERLCDNLKCNTETRDAIIEVSKTSYIIGTNVALNITSLKPDQKEAIRRSIEQINIIIENIQSILEL